MGSGSWKNLVFLFLQLTWVSGRTELEKEILQKLLLTSKLNFYVRPEKNANQTTGEPLEVSVSLFILNIDIDMNKQESTVQMYFREEWSDSRLAYNDEGKIQYLSVHDAGGFWTPDLFFVNEKFGQLHTVTKPNLFIRIYPNGRVFYSQRLTVKLACPMNLRRYPFDTQICSLPIESYGYTANDIMLKWKPEITFGLNEPSGYRLSFSPSEDIIHMATSNYSRLELGIHFTRLVHPQLIHVYIPLGLLVAVSWLSFWFRPSNAVLRLTTVLATTFTTLVLLLSARDLLHHLGYLTALDVWLGFSCLLLFAAVFENLYVIGSHDKALTFQTNKADAQELGHGEKDKRKLMDILAGKSTEGHSNVDTIARMTFPPAFVLFNLVYWAFYLI